MNLGEILNLKLGDIPFLIVLFIAFTCPFYGDAYYQVRKKLFKKMTRSEQEGWVESIHFDLFNKLMSMRDDPFMSDQKWRKWLPVCRYADEMLAIILPRTRLMKLEDVVHKIIGETDEIKI